MVYLLLMFAVKTNAVTLDPLDLLLHNKNILVFTSDCGSVARHWHWRAWLETRS
jgi:hypothetical protein